MSKIYVIFVEISVSSVFHRQSFWSAWTCTHLKSSRNCVIQKEKTHKKLATFDGGQFSWELWAFRSQWWFWKRIFKFFVTSNEIKNRGFLKRVHVIVNQTNTNCNGSFQFRHVPQSFVCKNPFPHTKKSGSRVVSRQNFRIFAGKINSYPKLDFKKRFSNKYLLFGSNRLGEWRETTSTYLPVWSKGFKENNGFAHCMYWRY